MDEGKENEDRKIPPKQPLRQVNVKAPQIRSTNPNRTMTNIRITNINSKWPLNLSTSQQINAFKKTKKNSHQMTYDICESGQPTTIKAIL